MSPTLTQISEMDADTNYTRFKDEQEKDVVISTKDRPKSNKKVNSHLTRLSLFHKKEVMLILLWNTLVFGYQFTVIQLFFSDYSNYNTNYWLTTFVALVFYYGVSKLFFPFAGWLADSHFGRYRVIKYSMWLMWLGSLLLVINRIVHYLLPNNQLLDAIMILVVFCINMVSLAGFHANIIPFGVDQLPDASTEQLKAFIRWYYWTRNIGVSILIPFNCVICSITSNVIIGIIFTVISSALCLSLALSSDFLLGHCVKSQYKKNNPFRLIRQVLFYAMKHPNPASRSALTYNQSYHPKRIDYSMDIYGGPFSYDEVEKVKTFMNMLKAILAIGAFSFTYVLGQNSIYYFTERVNITNGLFHSKCLTSDEVYWLLNPPIISLSIPLYEFVLYRPLNKYIPRTLRCIGIAIAIMLSVICIILILEVVGTIISSLNGNICTYISSSNADIKTTGLLKMSLWWAMIPVVLCTIAEMLGEIGAFEFICAQSPNTFKGFMIGLLYAVQGIFSLLAALVIVPFNGSQDFNHREGTVHCPLGFFSLQIWLGVTALIIYGVITHKYQQRQRDIITNEQALIEIHFEHMLDERDKYYNNT